MRGLPPRTARRPSRRHESGAVLLCLWREGTYLFRLILAKQRIVKITYWPIENIKPYARNARKIPPRAVDKVAESIEKFGWRQAVVVDSDGVIICGPPRWLAARKLGRAQVPVHQADNLSPAEVET